MIADAHLTNLECKNLMSARKNPSDIQELIEIECKNGFLYGPFSKPPFNEYRVSPLGLAIGKYSGKKRLIVDLSSPHSDPDNVSINELIDKESCRKITQCELYTPPSLTFGDSFHSYLK